MSLTVNLFITFLGEDIFYDNTISRFNLFFEVKRAFFLTG
jgi:hypothetical protein